MTDLAKNRAPLPERPKGFDIVVEIEQDKGKAVNVPAAESADDKALLEGAGLDPKKWAIAPGTRRHKRWQRYDGEWLSWWGFSFVEKSDESAEERRADIEDLKRLFAKRQPKALPPRPGGDDTFLIAPGDWQIGKNTAYTVEGVRDTFAKAEEHVRRLRKAGYKMPRGAMALLGDLHEGCDGHYAMQTFEVDLDRRGQNKVVRRLVREGIEILSPYFEEFIVTGVAGNHGENRKDGKAFTTFADNDDVAILEVLEEVFAGRSDFSNVRFAIPDDELSTCLDFGGVPVGFTHGNLLTRGGTLPQNKALNWWQGQVFGLGAVAPAKILLTGHYHHLTVSSFGPRTHIQIPAFDGGSKWWGDLTGSNSPDGTWVMRVDPNHRFGWDDGKVL